MAYESVDGATIQHAVNWSMNIPVRANEYAHIQSTTDDVDNLGHARQQTALGRVFDWEDPRPDYDEEIVSVARPLLVNAQRWIWRTESGFVTGHGTSTQLGRVDNRYDLETGDLLAATQAATLDGVPDYDFSGDAFGAEGYTLAAAYSGTHPELGSAQLLEASSRFDAWGNPVAKCGGADLNAAGDAACLRYATLAYDSGYAQLTVSESIAVDRDPSGDACDAGGLLCSLTTRARWDRGFGLLLEATDPNAESSTMSYDGLARLSSITPPAIDGDCSTRPVSILGYDLVADGQPLNVVRATQLTGCGSDDRFTIQTRSYLDGLGRARSVLTRAEGNVPDDAGARRWEQAGVATFTARGTATDVFNNAWIFADPPSHVEAVALADVPNTVSIYDAFGRPSEMLERDGSVSLVAYGALTTVTGDALDVGGYGESTLPEDPTTYLGTFTVSRVDGHTRPIDQALHQRNPGSVADDEFHRLFTRYRADNAVVEVTRAQTSSNGATDRTPVAGRSLTRTFTYDSMARRLGTIDPDSQDPDGAPASNNWRYLFNRVGDLVAVRDSRGCGQNFYYDWAGRLLAEDYVLCDEAQLPGESPDETLPASAIALEPTSSGGSQEVDCRYYFDVRAPWAFPGAPDDAHLRGRLTGSSDRGQREQTDFDSRGRPIWFARQMTLIPNAAPIAQTRTGELLSVDQDDQPTTSVRVFDEAHTYVSSNEYDRVDRPIAKTWPHDPDFEDPDMGLVPGPQLRGTLTYNLRSLPTRTRLAIDGASYEIVRSTTYEENRLVTRTNFGTGSGIRQLMEYDERLRPVRMVSRRDATPGAAAPSLSAVTRISDYNFTWDAVDNLLVVDDATAPSQWPSEQRPRRQLVQHDALYRVVNVATQYHRTRRAFATDNPASDWRETQQLQLSADPMRRIPAPMVSAQAEQRVADLTYQYDWLANMVEWTDDAGAFYERSLGGQIVNGFDEGLRPTALYLSTNIRRSDTDVDTSIDRGGWVRLRYGRNGNVQSVTVRARCVDRAPAACFDDIRASVDAREAHLVAGCRCAREQHYEYRWDEVNRIAAARRYDRAGSGDWALQVRQRYRYDGSNVRTIKQTVDGFGAAELERVALYVMPGEFERRGLVANQVAMTYDASPELVTETQYLVSGARVVWKSTPDGSGFERDARITMPMTNLIQSTTGVVDLVSGELLEVATFYPSGARESLRSNEELPRSQLEPMGFTGKEADDEGGLIYFGERYLLAHLGRWASADPLQVHQGGGGEVANGFHYVAGSLLQSRDPLGLSRVAVTHIAPIGAFDPTGSNPIQTHGILPSGSQTPTVPANPRTGRPAGAAGWLGYDGAYFNVLDPADLQGSAFGSFTQLSRNQVSRGGNVVLEGSVDTTDFREISGQRFVQMWDDAFDVAMGQVGMDAENRSMRYRTRAWRTTGFRSAFMETLAGLMDAYRAGAPGVVLTLDSPSAGMIGAHPGATVFVPRQSIGRVSPRFRAVGEISPTGRLVRIGAQHAGSANAYLAQAGSLRQRRASIGSRLLALLSAPVVTSITVIGAYGTYEEARDRAVAGYSIALGLQQNRILRETDERKAVKVPRCSAVRGVQSPPFACAH